MRIREIQAIGLRGATPEGGWSNELQEDDSVHTLVIVRTDEGITGTGSVFTSRVSIRLKIAVLAPIPSASESTATAVVAGVRVSERAPKRRS